ncbi:Hypothetical protein SCLAV_3778 [Streptomyces clavuligerus]|uniref:Uncharacterized protein n=1 Tax=Streptomyces clavuligerus TaxID=1901 RepID=E2Q3D5_STRCL|nr:Hypothetical protein SCLAV_3778 [Streptomyces clavuligerus]
MALPVVPYGPGRWVAVRSVRARWRVLGHRSGRGPSLTRWVPGRVVLGAVAGAGASDGPGAVVVHRCRVVPLPGRARRRLRASGRAGHGTGAEVPGHRIVPAQRRWPGERRGCRAGRGQRRVRTRRLVPPLPPPPQHPVDQLISGSFRQV